MNDGTALERLIGRLASLAGPPSRLVAWARSMAPDEGRDVDLFVVPVRPSASLNESIRMIQTWGHSSGALVTVRESADAQGFELAWLAAAAIECHDARPGSHSPCDLPTTPSTTVSDLLRLLQPRASVTLRLGDDELFLQPDSSPEPISDETAIESLRSLAKG